MSGFEIKKKQYNKNLMYRVWKFTLHTLLIVVVKNTGLPRILLISSYSTNPLQKLNIKYFLFYVHI